LVSFITADVFWVEIENPFITGYARGSRYVYLILAKLQA